MSRPSPYYQDDKAGVTIYHGDCLPAMRGMPTASVDAIVTDPPYFLPAQHYAVRKNWPRSLADLSILEHFFRDAFAEMRRVLRPNGAMAVFCDGQSYPVFYAMAYPHFDRLADLVWDKGVIGMGAGVRRQHELIMVGLPASFPWSGWTRSVLPFAPIPSADREHPAQKPLDLLGHLLRLLVPPGGTVLDPFAGLGTTPRAARENGYRAIGIEADERYAELAAQYLFREILEFGSRPVGSVEQLGIEGVAP